MKKIICLFAIICQLAAVSLYAADDASKGNKGIIMSQTPQIKEANPASTAQPAQVENAVQSEQAKNVEQPIPVKEQSVQTKEQPEQIKEQPVQAKKVEPPPVQSKMVLREKVSDQNPLRKIARGTVNVTLGWTEIPRQMIKVNKENGDIAGVFWGPLKGFAFFIGRTAVGVYEVTTFLLPPYKPVVKPEFILSDDSATDNE